MESLSSLRVFVEVVKQGSFSRAAEVMGSSKSHVSKQIKQLERELGVTLLHRTTRQQSLSENGRLLFERCRQLFEELEDTLCLVQSRQTLPQGKLRISAPFSMSLGTLGKLVCGFSAKYPEIEVEFHLSDRYVDLIEEGYDIVLRAGQLQDSSLMARRLAPIRRYLCASPGYLEQHGNPKSPEEIREHSCLLYQHPRSSDSWSFVRGDEKKTVRVQGSFRTNNGDVLLQGALEGHGVVLLPDFLVSSSLQKKDLVRLLPEWDNDWHASLWLLFPPHAVLSTKVRAFVEYMVDGFTPNPPWV